LATRQNLFVASVALIEALGGGWNKSKLPTPAQATPPISIFPQDPAQPPPVVVEKEIGAQ